VCAGLIKCFSTRSCRSSGGTSARGMNSIRPRVPLVACRARLVSLITYALCSSSAMDGNGTPAKLRARRTRLPMTMSRSGPVPFIHWLSVLLMRSLRDKACAPSSQALLKAANLVPKASGLLVRFPGDGLLEPAPAPFDLPPAGEPPARQPLSPLPGVLDAAVNPLEQGLQFPLELGVTLAAAQLADAPVVGKAQAAVAAPERRRPGRVGDDDRLGLEEAREDIVKSEAGLDIHLDLSSFLGALRAQVQLGLLIVDDPGDVNGRRFLMARLAHHGGFTPLLLRLRITRLRETPTTAWT